MCKLVAPALYCLEYAMCAIPYLVELALTALNCIAGSSLVKPPEWLGPLVICTPDLDGTCRSLSGEFSSFAHPWVCTYTYNRHPLVDGELFFTPRILSSFSGWTFLVAP